MAVTTEFGTWYNHTHGELTVEADIANYVGAGPRDWVERLTTEGYFDQMVAAFRAQINACLPNSVALCGNDFYGPYYSSDQKFDGYPVDCTGALDIESIIRDIDLEPIIQRFDPDLIVQDATLGVRAYGWQTLTIGAITVELPVRSSEAIPAALLHQLAAHAMAEHGWEPAGPWTPTTSGFCAPVTRV